LLLPDPDLASTSIDMGDIHTQIVKNPLNNVTPAVISAQTKAFSGQWCERFWLDRYKMPAARYYF